MLSLRSNNRLRHPSRRLKDSQATQPRPRAPRLSSKRVQTPTVAHRTRQPQGGPAPSAPAPQGSEHEVVDHNEANIEAIESADESPRALPIESEPDSSDDYIDNDDADGPSDLDFPIEPLRRHRYNISDSIDDDSDSDQLVDVDNEEDLDVWQMESSSPHTNLTTLIDDDESDDADIEDDAQTRAPSVHVKNANLASAAKRPHEEVEPDNTNAAPSDNEGTPQRKKIMLTFIQTQPKTIRKLEDRLRNKAAKPAMGSLAKLSKGIRASPNTGSLKSTSQLYWRLRDRVVAQIITVAKEELKVTLFTQNAFPTAFELKLFAKDALECAVRIFGYEKALDPDVLNTVVNLASSIRGHVRQHAAVKLPPLFQLDKDYPAVTKSKAECAIWRGNYRFHEYGLEIRDDPRNGIYQHPSLAEVLIPTMGNFETADWDDGHLAQVAAQFNPIPLPFVAFGLTVTYCTIDEWKTGKRVTESFSGGRYRNVYKKLLQALEDWVKTHKKEWDIISSRLTEAAIDRFWNATQTGPSSLTMASSEPIDFWETPDEV